MGRALDWMTAENRRRDVERRLLPAVLLLKATALALRRVPQLNGFWIDGTARLSQAIHVGWAISLRGGGLMAPAIRDADTLSLDQAMAALRDLVTRARTARIRGSEMMDPTVTVTSLGERGAQSVLGVIYPPQLAIVGFGAIRPCPAVVEDRIAIQPIIHASLAADHRASDGETGGRLLAAIDHLLQEPEKL
jgi:pyruvate dehydrogenase E2 component (dihydrolipoamide acetyltransferase)